VDIMRVHAIALVLAVAAVIASAQDLTTNIKVCCRASINCKYIGCHEAASRSYESAFWPSEAFLFANVLAVLQSDCRLCCQSTDIEICAGSLVSSAFVPYERR